MYLFSVDFSADNLLTEQISVNSLYNLPVMNNLLIEQQLANFADLSVKKAFLTDCSIKFEAPLFETLSINDNELFKALALIDDCELFFAFRNDVYFETDDLSSFVEEGELKVLTDKNGLSLCVAGTIGELKRLYNKNNSLKYFLKSTEKIKCRYKEIKEGYVNHLKSIKNYKGLLQDILNNKTYRKPPFVAEGVFTDGAVPKGDFFIIPPVFIGKGVQIESGAVIGPDTVIYENTLIAENTSVKNSILFENVYVSSGCFIDGAVCCDNASIKRNSSVFSESLIGANALIGEEMTLENGSVINKNVRFDKFDFLRLKKHKIQYFSDMLQGLLPDKAVALGSAFAEVFKKPKLIIGSDGSLKSLSLRLAFISGSINGGCQCLDVGTTFKSHIFFSAEFCDCDFSVYFSCIGNEAGVEIFNQKNEKLSRSQCCNLLDFLYDKDDISNNTEGLGCVRQIKGLRRMYIREIIAFSDNQLPSISKIFCNNKLLVKTLEEIFEKCASEDGSELVLKINSSATNISMEFEGRVFQQKVLKKLVSYFMRTKTDLKITDSKLYERLWRCDSVVLVMAVLNILKKTGKTLDVLIDELPYFFISSRELDFKPSDKQIADCLSDKYRINHHKGSFKIKCKDGYVKLSKNEKNGKIRILAASESLAMAEELSEFFSGLLQSS